MSESGISGTLLCKVSSPGRQRLVSDVTEIGHFYWWTDVTLNYDSKLTESERKPTIQVDIFCDAKKPSDSPVYNLWHCTGCLDVVVASPNPHNNCSMTVLTSFGSNIVKKFATITFDGKSMPNLSELRFPDEAIHISIDVQIIRSTSIPLEKDRNDMILSAKDAAKFQVAEGKNRPSLWLSKAILSRNSPVFMAMFEDDFREKTTNLHVINDCTLEEFLRFIALMYPVKYEFVDTTLPAVMRLADMYQCTYVISRCEQFLRSDESKSMAPMTKFAIADEFNLADDVRDEIVKKIPIEELKKVVRSGRHRVFSDYSRDIIERQLAAEPTIRTIRDSLNGNQ
ncbi:hypothetical protein L596_009892 [Steinernema carpocapsae]|uniref:BTB domain-containing protein n=1 Tax=Steinernema carpocapsae TaxID=34508 RepID=A0A4U5PGW9_STECR|nr:hypothetical protein L596_009892 [Steinernema carpocapsae]